MQGRNGVRRAVLVVLDGLRPDAIEAFDLANVRRLARVGASTLTARTVSPSLTWPALASLLTGVAPERHGVFEDSVHLPRPRGPLEPLPKLLVEKGFPSSAFLGAIPPLYRGIANHLSKGLGFAEARFVGGSATEILLAARPTLRAQRRGLIFMHWPDADCAGHEHGWMSEQYGESARRLDLALGRLAQELEIEADPHGVLVALADHGGGGNVRDHHDGDHPVNSTIPMLFAGGSIARGDLARAGLLDVPATIAWLLGLAPPASYAGRVLSQIVESDEESAVA